MKTINASSTLDLGTFVSQHGFGVIVAVVLAVVCAWVLADRL
jgi:hypothetical protein